MKVILAKTAGFCFGVNRAVKLVEEAAGIGPCATLGPIIHNRHVTGRLSELGVIEISQPEELPAGSTAIIRSHGVAKGVFEALNDFVDATCPYVSRIHKIVSEACSEGRQVVIIGQREHPEIKAIAGWCASEPQIFETAQELSLWLGSPDFFRDMPLTLVSQTTATKSLWSDCLEITKKQCTNYRIFDTICIATENRQNEAAELASRCNAMVVVGDRTSSNTKRLWEICKSICPIAVLVDNAAELDLSLLMDAATVGLTAGASTPAWIIKEVYNKMTEEIRDKEVNEGFDTANEPVSEAQQQDSITSAPVEEEASSPDEESFAELLELSFKTLNTGEKVSGVVTSISSNEIYVELGTKHTGYIPVSEMSDDPSVKAEDLFKIGDVIETYVLRVNDVEGTAMLSKKRLDTVKSWDDVEIAREEKTTVEGIVTEENKGGVVVSVKGVRVFVPASQTGLGKDVPMTTLLKTKVKLRITEVNRARRRVVGSIRAVQFEERRGAAEKVWAEIEAGKKYTGVVKSLTSYGAFVDIGGVDGMVHVSELSWSRVKHPSEVLSVGDIIDVVVLAVDTEKKKISLGYKSEANNPWSMFTAKYNIGDIVNVKIVKLMDFGAFASVMSGVDGLIHISQIADKRINKPGDVLSEGQNVDVKIIDVDNEKKKISLSIRAVLQDQAAQDEEQAQINATLKDEVIATAE